MVHSPSTRRGLLRLARLSAIGIVSLSLTVACSDYGTTGSGGTSGAGPETTTGTTGSAPLTPVSGSGSGGAGGGSTTDKPSAGTVPTAQSTADIAVPRRDGTPLTAGSGGAVATSEAMSPRASGGGVSPASSPSPTSTSMPK